MSVPDRTFKLYIQRAQITVYIYSEVAERHNMYNTEINMSNEVKLALTLKKFLLLLYYIDLEVRRYGSWSNYSQRLLRLCCKILRLEQCPL